MDKIETKRLTYEHQGRKIYEWEQSLEEVHVFIEVPPGVRSKMLDVTISAAHLKVGLKGNPPFLDEPFQEKANATDSFWTLEDGVLHLSITKGSKGLNWSCLLQGHTVNDPYTASEVQKSLMLERFQAEVCARARAGWRRTGPPMPPLRCARAHATVCWGRPILAELIPRAPARALRIRALTSPAPPSMATCRIQRPSWAASATIAVSEDARAIRARAGE